MQVRLQRVLTEYNEYRCSSISLCWLVLVVVVVDLFVVLVCCL